MRPGENKIQFLIANPTAEQRVAGLEMFQQMCHPGFTIIFMLRSHMISDINGDGFLGRIGK